MMSPPLELMVSSWPLPDVEGADLATGHLRDVDPAVGAGAQAVGTEQPTRRGEPLHAPALGEGR